MKRTLDQLSDAELDALIAHKKAIAQVVAQATPRDRGQPIRPQTTATGAFGRGALDSATLNFAPKIVGAVGAPIVQALRPDLFGDKEYDEVYKELRDTTRAQQKQAAEEHPYANFAGNIAGSVALPFPAKTVKGAAKLGALYGGAQALGGNDEGEVGSLSADDALAFLSGAGQGAVLGGTAQGLINRFLPKKNPASPETMERLGLSQEFDTPITLGEATGSPQQLLQEEAALKGRLGSTNQENMREFKDVRGQSFKDAASRLRESVGGEEFVSKGAAAGDVVNKIQREALDARDAYSKLYQEAKQTVAKVDTTDLREFTKLAVVDLEEAAITADNAPKTFGEIKALTRILGRPNIKLNELEAWKQGLNRSIRDVPRGGQEEFALKQLSQKFDGYLDGVIDKALVEGDTEALQKFREARKLAAQWHARYGAKDASEFGKKFIEDIVDNARFSREPYSDEMLVNKILGTSELGFKAESAGIVQEIKRQVGQSEFKKIKLEAANKLLAPLFSETPNVTTYRNNLKRLVEGNPTLAKELFSKDELAQLEKLGKLGQALFTRQKSLTNPSGTAEVLIDFIGRKSGFGWAKEAIGNLLTKKIPLEQDAVRKAAMAGTKMPREMSAVSKAILLGGQGSLIGDLASAKSFDGLSDKELDALIAQKQQAPEQSPQIENQTSDLPTSPSESRDTGISRTASLLDKIAYIESSNNPNARNQTSSASGLLQFTDGTWKDAVSRYGSETGITMQDKDSPRAQRIMASKMLASNSRELQQFLGREPSDGELYLTHFLGLDGAKKLMRYHGTGAAAARVLPAAARANRSIFFDNGKPRTVEQVYSLISRKI